jgi:hypothetical protein
MASFMEDDFWAHLSSNVDNEELYPDNRPNKFTVRLPVQLNFFNKHYKVALWYVSIPTFWNVINDKNKKVLVGEKKTRTQRVERPFRVHTVQVQIPSPPQMPTTTGTGGASGSAAAGSSAAESSVVVGEKRKRSDDESDDEQDSKRIKLEDADFLKTLRYRTTGALMVSDYARWIRRHIPEALLDHFDVSSKKITNLQDPSKETEITFEVKDENTVFKFDGTFIAFWKKLGIREDDIDVNIAHTLKIKTSKYLRFPTTTRSRLITVSVGIPAGFQNVPVQYYAETSFDLPTGFFETPTEFLDTLETIPAPYKNIFEIMDKKMVVKVPAGKEMKFNKQLAQLFGFPADKWLGASGEIVGKKIFTCHPVTTFYLYSNLITPQITSNTFTPVLYEIVPHKGDGSISYLSDSTPHYIPKPLYKRVSAQSVSELTFIISDQLGNEIDFINGSGETSVILHFKKDKDKQ